MSLRGRLATALALFLAVVGLALWVVFGFITPTTPTTDFTSAQPAGSPVNLTIQAVGAIGFGPHPTWVSYLVKTPAGKWIQSTIWKLPAHTKVNLTIMQYDSGSPLRNQIWGQVAGTQGGTELLNGKPISFYNSYGGNGVGHTFAVPAIGLVVPLVGVPSSAPNICGTAPCTPNYAHNVIKVSFTTPSAGSYSWQCFVPCGLGTLYGNGGPMGALGYMGGFLDVTA